MGVGAPKHFFHVGFPHTTEGWLCRADATPSHPNPIPAILFHTCPYTAIISSTSDLPSNQSICRAEIEHLKSNIVLQGQINICIFKGKQMAHNRAISTILCHHKENSFPTPAVILKTWDLVILTGVRWQASMISVPLPCLTWVGRETTWGGAGSTELLILAGAGQLLAA